MYKGELERAVELQQKVLERTQRNLGHLHPATVGAYD